MTSLGIGNSTIRVIRVSGAVGAQGTPGTPGVEGEAGPQGQDGTDGVGVPTGGTIGQVLSKIDAADYNTQWTSAPASILEAVDGGDGFANVSGAVVLNLASAREFHQTMTGNITGLSFTNVPAVDDFSATWTWVLQINGTGGYILSGTPSVTWVDGRTWADLDLSPNAVNIVVFTRKGAVTYASLMWNGELQLEPYKICFLDNGTITLLAEAERLELGDATKNGDGTITYTKNGSAASGSTTFAEGDVIGVVCTGATGTTTVRIPRYAL